MVLKNKFHNVKVWHDGIKFDSKKERDYSIILDELVEQGYIKDIYRQVTFPLPNCHYNAKKEYIQKPRNLKYRTDFVVKDWKNRFHIIDTKGHFEKASQIKIAYVEYVYGVFVRLVSVSRGEMLDTSFITDEDLDETLYNKKLPKEIL
jgi:hypothetical protein